MYKQKKKDSETDFSSDSDYDEMANEIPFLSNILHPFQFEPVLTAAELVLVAFDAQPAHLVGFAVKS